MALHRARAGAGLARLLAVAAIAVAAAGCETTAFDTLAGRPGEGRAERLAESGRHADAAGEYIGLAADAAGAQRDRLTLLAAEQWLDAGDVSRARSAFASVPEPTAPELRQLWNTTRAAFLLYRGEPDAALAILEPMSREPLATRQRLRVEALRADAWIQKGDPQRAIELMRHREAWLDGRQDVEENRWRLWRGLTVSDPDSLRDAAGRATDAEVRGWLTLASLAASTGQQGIGWTNGAVRWRQTHAGHPALTILDRLDLPDAVILDYPRQIALLLPLSGRAAAAGRALQHGFLGAYYASLSGLDDPQRIRVYDVNEEGGASAAYSAAVNDGAEFVIGPLLRNNVIELANDILVPVPVLTLNYLPDEQLAPPGLYQFALAPEDEARDAAGRAIADGHTRGVALVPNTDWGRRVLTSFATEFERLGGTLLDYRSYIPSNPDFSAAIEDLMGLSGSVSRYQRLRANIGGPLQFDPRRRQDSEFIFLAADAPAGRLLKAQLKFHYSGDLPVYSTSSINAQDGRSDTDLNGIMFADTPWVIAPQTWLAHLPPLYAEYWPEERRLGRLHAMGYDAYQLIGAIHAARTGPMPEIDGASGRLYLDNDGRVHRRLAWARFQRGEPVWLPDRVEPHDPVPGSGDEADLPDGETDDERWYEGRREL
ncbi:MAG: penicillin-binding protein activator [Woeseiaceae bacterium]|nr:penicillin-binding protein activator [Woeseiaceae bacterium]